MTYTEQQIAEALGSSKFYEHTSEQFKEQSFAKHDKDSRRLEKARHRVVSKPRPKAVTKLTGRMMPLAYACASAYEVEQDSICSDSRAHDVVKAKRLFAWALRSQWNYTYPKIASVMGVDHSTAMYHFNKFEGEKHQHADIVARIIAVAAL